MREIEKRICNELHNGHKTVRLSSRDDIKVDSDGRHCYYLFISCLATLTSSQLDLGVCGGKYQTNTTKSRLNAIASSFGVPCIQQKNFVWTWTDGVPYDGIRNFIL